MEKKNLKPNEEDVIKKYIENQKKI